MAYARYHRTMARRPGILRTADGVFIPEDPDNADWQAYLAWCAEGNVPTPIPVGKVPGSLSDPDAVASHATKEESPWQKATSSPPETETPSSPPPPEPPTRKASEGIDI